MTLWFSASDTDKVEDVDLREMIEKTIQIGINEASIETWLEVIPQLISRISTKQDLVCKLLEKIGVVHPQVVLYPLTVASQLSEGDESKASGAADVLVSINEIYPKLVREALLVSRELIRVAMLWHGIVVLLLNFILIFKIYLHWNRNGTRSIGRSQFGVFYGRT